MTGDAAIPGPTHPPRARGPLPRPQPKVLSSLRLDVLVRDHPEALAVLRDRGLDPRDVGDRTLAAAAGGSLAAMLEDLREALP